MSDNNNPSNEEQNQEKQGLEKFYEFDKKTLKPENKTYFDEVKDNLQKVRQVKQKIQAIKQELQKKVAELQQKISSKQPIKAPKDGKTQGAGNKQEDMDKADLEFCQHALSEAPLLSAANQSDENTLQRILTTKNKESYSVIVDIALKPLPSQRAKDKDDKSKDDKNKDDKNKDGKNKDDKQNIAQKNENGARKLTPKELQQLRMGKPLSFKPQQQTETKPVQMTEQQLQFIKNQKSKGSSRI